MVVCMQNYIFVGMYKEIMIFFFLNTEYSLTLCNTVLCSYYIQLYEHNESQKNTILKAKELCREDEMFTGL